MRATIPNHEFGKGPHVPCSVIVCALATVMASSWVNAQDLGGNDKSPNPQSVSLFGRVEPEVGLSRAVTKSENTAVERGFLDVTLPGSLDTVVVDHARLILSVSTVFDSTEPLIIAAFPATISSGSRPTEWSKEWDEMSGGFDAEHMEFVSVESSEEAIEIVIDITQLVQLWQSGSIPNHGLVIKTLSENKSTFHWIRDGRYGGKDAKLEVWYSQTD